jgi:hypothetical protein
MDSVANHRTVTTPSLTARGRSEILILSMAIVMLCAVGWQDPQAISYETPSALVFEPSVNLNVCSIEWSNTDTHHQCAIGIEISNNSTHYVFILHSHLVYSVASELRIWRIGEEAGYRLAYRFPPPSRVPENRPAIKVAPGSRERVHVCIPLAGCRSVLNPKRPDTPARLPQGQYVIDIVPVVYSTQEEGGNKAKMLFSSDRKLWFEVDKGE